MGEIMEIIKKWVIKHYLWLMLGCSILAIGFAGVTIYQVYQLMTLNVPTISQKSFKIIPKHQEEDIRNVITLNVCAGDTVEKISQKLEKAGIISRNDFFTYLKQGQINLEGIVFEGEYSIPVPSTPKEIHSILTEPYAQWIKNESKKFISLGRTPVEIITIASMIEKEAAEDSERPIIAGVIYNRLKNNMKLQIDATVIYALGEHKSRLTYEDLKVNSPYNTYIIEGLPPGPICTPRKASIEAALNPDMHSYFYYVLSSYGSQKHLFAETYEEHLSNVEKYKTTVK
ncbi:MAG: hypothetical protein JG775_1601 [Defluviitaleaceae bacterium]|nr:hypothetical protein [Defluviitaleaceae bacterium]